MSLITVKQLTKNYGNNRGIFDISFEVKQGEIFGYVGTNGSGKTTTIRSMLGFIHPHSGSVAIAGLNPVTHSADLMQKISYIPGEINFPALPSGTVFLKLQAQYNQITDLTYMNYVADKLALDTSANLKRMSKGMKQKTAIVAALMSNRDILVLDEPTTGLDPLMRDVFLDLIREEKRKGKTIFLSGHIFEELEEVCDTVAMLKNGHIISIIDMHNLHHKSNRDFEITFENQKIAKKFVLQYPKKAKVKNETVKISLPVSQINELFKVLSKYKVKLLKENNLTLKDLFMKEYNHDNN